MRKYILEKLRNERTKKVGIYFKKSPLIRKCLVLTNLHYASRFHNNKFMPFGETNFSRFFVIGGHVIDGFLNLFSQFPTSICLEQLSKYAQRRL